MVTKPGLFETLAATQEQSPSRHALLRYALVRYAPVRSSIKRFDRQPGWANQLSTVELCDEAREMVVAPFVCLARSHGALARALEQVAHGRGQVDVSALESGRLAAGARFAPISGRSN